MYLMLEVAVDHSTTTERDHSSTIEKDLSSMIERDLNSTTEIVHSSMIGKKSHEANGKTTRRTVILQKMISKDLKDQATILGTDNSGWTKLETNQSRNSIIVLRTKLKKRGTKESIKEIKEIDHLKSNSDEL